MRVARTFVFLRWLARRYAKPAVAVVCLLIATLALWRALINREQVQIDELADGTAQGIANRLAAEIAMRTQPIERLARRWSLREQPWFQEWSAEAELFAGPDTGVQAIAWVEPSLLVRWYAPAGGNSALEGLDLSTIAAAGEAFDRARRTRKPAASRGFQFAGGPVFLVCAPIDPGHGNDGFIAGLFRTPELVQYALAHRPDSFSVVVYEGGRRLYPERQPQTGDRVITREVAVHGVPWRLQVWPTTGWVAAARSRLPQFTLITGIALSLLLALAIRLAEAHHAHAAVLRSVNRQLGMEIRYREEIADELRRAYEILASIIETCPLAIVGTDAAGTVRTWNPAASALFGWTAEEVLGRVAPFLESIPGLRPAGPERMLHEQRQLSAKDGRALDAEMWGAVQRHPGGAFAGVVWLIADQTERKLLEERLRKTAEMAGITRLAGGLAHDLNNLLGVVIGYSEVARNAMGDHAAIRHDLDEVLAAASRAAALVGQMLAFGRGQTIQPRELDVNEFVLERKQSLQDMLGNRISLITTVAPNIGRVRADPAQLGQALCTLALNARDAMPQGGRLSIETAEVRLGREEAWKLQTEPGLYVTIAVADTGAGMDEESRAHVFEPFYTPTPGTSSGLGLSTVYGIVQQHGGGIGVESAVGKGTTFRIYLRRI